MAEENGTNVRLVKPNVRKIMRPYMNIGVYVRVSSSLILRERRFTLHDHCLKQLGIEARRGSITSE